VFKVNPKTGALSVLHGFTAGADGAAPLDALIYNNGTLFGTTWGGGGTGCEGGGCGTVFSVNPKTHVETVLHRFSGGADGGNPYAGLAYQDGSFFGTTSSGGASNYGTVFKLTP
jgi:uncharacterized repeat protein (TIGR03803 family)